MHKPYLVKEYASNPASTVPTITTRFVDDRPDPFDKESVWYWMNEAANGRIKACFFALCDVPDDPAGHEKIIMIGGADERDSPYVDCAVNLKIAELKADPSVKSYLLQCVLDLS
jgi:hypothetical protein